MAVFLTGLLLLVVGYFFYGGLVASTVKPDPNRVTPAIAMADGVDYVALPTWRVYLIQLLNIAGLGPVFGPIMGALWGPQVFLWVVFGCILGGAVHDFLIGAMSIRNDGAGLPDLIGHYLGPVARHISTSFIMLLMLLVGTVFVKGPAMLLEEIAPPSMIGGLVSPDAVAWLEKPVLGASFKLSDKSLTSLREEEVPEAVLSKLVTLKDESFGDEGVFSEALGKVLSQEELEKYRERISKRAILGISAWLWLIMAAIYAYYIVATLLPIDKIIGRFYPIFSIALLVMVAGLGVSLVTGRLTPPPFTLANLHPKGLPAWPLIFITVSCGAVSGFHATQSPLMARCLKSEKHMRVVFYGAMIAEGLIALVWASAAQGFYPNSASLQEALTNGGPGMIVHDTCIACMGAVGGALAVLGVVVLPITSGDTAFRVGRLILADYFRLPQKNILNRYVLALPLFVLSFSLNFVNFGLIWRYFGWANQTLSAVALWAATAFLARRHRRWWIPFFPAVFMTVVTATYILVEKVGFGLDPTLGTILGLVIGLAFAGWFLLKLPKMEREEDTPSVPAGSLDTERSADSLAC